MATESKENAKCPKCGREPVKIYYDRRTGKWMCGKCGQQEDRQKKYWKR